MEAVEVQNGFLKTLDSDVIMVDAFHHDGSKKPKNDAKKTLKRKRCSTDDVMSSEDREARIAALREELNGLFKYFKEAAVVRLCFDESSNCSSNSAIACLLEESDLPFSKLVEEIYEKLKLREGTTLVSVKKTVLAIGHRAMYGIESADADVLEDETASCLWCWETRDMKLLPKEHRGVLTVRRTCRKKIRERILAVSAMISTLATSENLQNCKNVLMRASEKLGKVLDETRIRSLVEELLQKISSDTAEKDAKLKEKEVLKELEKKMRNEEKEKKKIDRELQKENQQSEKEQKRLQEEAEKEARRREKEEAEFKKQQKRQQEEAEKELKRQEKEKAEIKKQLAVQKQATLMERFLKKKQDSYPDNLDDRLQTKTLKVDTPEKSEEPHNSVALVMDHALSQDTMVDPIDLRKTHLELWQNSRRSIRFQCWGVRHNPKSILIKKLKLQGALSDAEHSEKVTSVNKKKPCSELSDDNISCPNMLIDGCEETSADDQTCHSHSPDLKTRLPRRNMKLLQFDKSHRPAYYGTYSKKSNVVGPRHPFKKDPTLDYDVDSDEEWEEEDPGESLSDCDKDNEEESLEEEILKADDDESEDSFFVPDGYLSENEGVQTDSRASDAVDGTKSSADCREDVESEEFRALFQQQKYLNDWTERALRKSEPLIISNLRHEKASFLKSEEVSGQLKRDQLCLLALSIHVFPGGSPIEISMDDDTSNDDVEVMSSSGGKNSCSPQAAAPVISELDLPEVVHSIQSFSQSINKAVKSVQQKFPAVPKMQIKNKIKEISVFVDNRWQVKKEVLDKLGLSPSPVADKVFRTNKGIMRFFTKRCLPLSREAHTTPDLSPQPCQKSRSLLQNGMQCVENRIAEDME
ncbi:Chromatin assembly factor 1 subunit FSM [Acorus calamus]|uniref:Chromatin assembly factor 1 subunit FSM n=1 Tax=Acorus calamus TaxID=4465 RepID=A0AAV9CG14_ACOCL|nr:Chromatin assembly factor 1 subunit FSM [Acorus calamus]